MFRFLVTAFLMGTLTCSQLQPTLAINENKIYKEEGDKTILDTVVVKKAAPLSEIELPKCEYGKLTWENPDYVPEDEEEDCKVLLKPEEGVDVSWMKGWDAKEQVVHAYITVRMEFEAEEIGDSVENTVEVQEETADDPNWNETEASENIENADSVKDDVNSDAETAGNVTDPSMNAESSVATDVSEEDTSLEKNEDTEVGKSNEAADLDSDEKDVLGSDKDNAEVLPEESKDLIADEDSAADADENPDADEDSTTEPDENLGSDQDSDIEEDAGADQDNGAEETPDTDLEEGPETDRVETIFDRAEIAEDTRPEYADESLNEEERQAVAAQNHNCEGITIYGENLPWYVQFRVYDGQEYQFSNQDGAELFKAYEFQLWDTLHEQEYEVPEGEYVTIRMNVPTGYSYTVEHIVASGGRESIRPTIDGNTLVFSTHSFSPFGIAGSVVLVGGDILEGNYTKPNATPTPTPTPTPGSVNKGDVPSQNPGSKPTQNAGSAGGNQSSTGTSGSTSGNGTGSVNQGVSTGNTGTSVDHSNQNTAGNNNSQNGTGSINQNGTQNTNHSNPETGDSSPIALLAGVAGAALLLIVAAGIFLLRRKK